MFVHATIIAEQLANNAERASSHTFGGHVPIVEGMSGEQQRKPSGTERLWRFGRDINALGALAIAGVALLIPGPNVLLATWAGWNGVQAVGFEWLRGRAARSYGTRSSAPQNIAK